MAKKSDKKMTYLTIGAVVAVIIVVIVVIIINNNNKTVDTSSGVNTSETSSGVSSGDLKNVNVEISYGDFDAMKTLSSDIQNGRMTGKVVKIDGLVSHPGRNYSVVQKNADGTQKIGTVFNIQDGGDSDYPADGAHVVITAKVVEKEPLNYQLVTLKEFVKKQ